MLLVYIIEGILLGFMIGMCVDKTLSNMKSIRREKNLDRMNNTFIRNFNKRHQGPPTREGRVTVCITDETEKDELCG